MRRNSPGTFLGTRPRGEIRKFSKGGVSKGPIIRPDNTSLFSLSVTARGYSIALFRFFERHVILSPKYRIEKPKTEEVSRYGRIIPSKERFQPVRLYWSWATI